jgi:chitin disaccharide deacetylase
MLFHTDFNRTVENFYRAFTFVLAFARMWREKCLATDSAWYIFLSPERELPTNERAMKELILNADDFGLTKGVNEGIIRAHREGVLTSATLMANGSAFEHAVECARANPKLGVGCHLMLAGGPPVAAPEEIPSLVDKNGRLPDSLSAFVARVSSGRIRTKDIERELRAQIEKIRRAGIEPTHLDTHKHTHAHPRVMKVLAQLAQELGITRVRRPAEGVGDSWKLMFSEGGASPKQVAAVAAVRVISARFSSISRKYGLRSPDNFLGVAATGQLGAEALCHLIDTLAEGRTEIMLHPGVCDEDLARTGSRLQQQRQLELDGLLAPQVRRAIEHHGIRLITYRELN